MKREIKIIILSALVFCGVYFALVANIIQGALLIMFAFIGVFIIEGRQVRRTIDFFDPLLFRCGRLIYVEDGIRLLKKSLLFKTFYNKRLLYLELGLLNIKGEYDQVVRHPIIMRNSKENYFRLVINEVNYATLKLGVPVDLPEMENSHREQLIKCLNMIQNGESEIAIDALQLLREEEAGNVIFKEVNELLGDLVKESHPEESLYYKMISDMFSKERNH